LRPAFASKIQSSDVTGRPVIGASRIPARATVCAAIDRVDIGPARPPWARRRHRAARAEGRAGGARGKCFDDYRLDPRHQKLSRHSNDEQRASWRATRPSPAIRTILRGGYCPGRRRRAHRSAEGRGAKPQPIRSLVISPPRLRAIYASTPTVRTLTATG